MLDGNAASLEESSLAAALVDWRDAIGAAHVSVDPDLLGGASTATFDISSRARAILRPANRDEVQRCVRTANHHRIPIYPISTGKNWGYGSRAPVSDGVLFDLGRLNRIVDFNEELAYVTLEPGVTQRQLYEFLRARGSRLWMDATGSSPDCSVIGNTLERGFGHTPMGDHCANACGLEVVLPNGDCLETGFGRFSNTTTGSVSRWGVGPSLDGLFFQASLGVVTRMTVWLMPAPECFQAFIFQSDAAVGPIIDALRPLRLNGTIGSVVHIGNDYKVLSGTGSYPWEATGGKTPLTPDTMAKLRRELRISRWSGSGGLYGTPNQVREAKSLLRRGLAGVVDRLQFIDDRRLALIRRLEKPYRLLTGRHDLERALKLLPPLVDVLKGVPTDAFLSSAYWRKKLPPTRGRLDPDADRCGLLWCSPVAPNSGKAVEQLVEVATAIVLEHGFEPIISVSVLNPRATVSTIALTYDREVPGEDSRARACYDALMQQLLKRGYPPYRLNIASMHYGDVGTHANVIEVLKTALDAHRIMAPGRYEAPEASAKKKTDDAEENVVRR